MLAAMAGMFFLGQATGSEPIAPSITEIQELGDLVVLRVSVADVLRDDGFQYKSVLAFRGDALVAVDMRAAVPRPTSPESKTLVVELPQPRVISPRVDHEKSEMLKPTKTTWVPFVGDREALSNQTWAKAQRRVERVASEKETIDQARDQTEFLLTNMYRLVGWKVEVVWQDDLDSSKSAK